MKHLEIGNADDVNLGARGHKTGGCYARYQPFSSIKPGTRRTGLTVSLWGESGCAVQCIKADDGCCANSGCGEGAALENVA